jgi:hypothetical protein
MASTIDIYNDVQNNVLYGSANASRPLVIPDLYQYGTLQLRWYPVRPTYSVLPPFFSNVDLDQLTLKMAIGPRAGAESPISAQYTWTKAYTSGASGPGYMYANLDLNTTEVNTAIGTSDSITSYFEITMSEDGVPRVVYQTPVRIISAVTPPGSASSLPTPAASYLSREECMELFVKWANNQAGKTITLTSPDGTRDRIIGVRNDGSAQDDF